MKKYRDQGDRGVTMVEFALVFTLLLMIAIGAFEFGMAFRDSLTVATATREAGRVAAATANHGDDDCVILEAASGVLQSLDSGTIDEVRIYRSDESGSIPATTAATMRRYANPRGSTPDLNCSGGSWLIRNPGPAWEPSDRVTGAGILWIGVQVTYDHEWITNFLWWNGTMSLSDDAVFRIEPPAPD